MVSLSTSQWVAPASFAFNFGAQLYGIYIAEPNMQTVSERYVSFFSPKPQMIGLFFLPQQILQLVWMKTLYDGSANAETLSFVPYYVLGNACIGLWSFFWTNEKLAAANVFVLVNSFAQLYYIWQHSDYYEFSLTQMNARTFAGIGVLDFLHNGSVAYFRNVFTPSTLVYVATGLGFLYTASRSGLVFGACLAYDLLAMALEQSRLVSPSALWPRYLQGLTLLTTGIVALKRWVL